MQRLSITIVGGGILGLWQALVLARRGHDVRLFEAAEEGQSGAASRIAGAMLAPDCEAEQAEPIVRELGRRGLSLWKDVGANITMRGTLVVAMRRDHSDLRRFADRTGNFRWVGNDVISALEPGLAGRFATGLHFPDEAHMAPREAIAALIGHARRLGAELRFSAPVPQPVWMAAAAGELVIDCRGIAARSAQLDLRGVRGEMVVVEASGVALTRPLRLLHPRAPIYIVPWGRNFYMIGATVIETNWTGPVTLRSALDLLSTATAVHDGFLDARIVEMSAGVRPAFADNVPKIHWHGRCLSVNGAYRHGFLLAPALAEIVADHLEYATALPPELEGK